MTIEVSTTDKRDGKALALFANWQSWQQGRTRDGRSFFAIPGSQPNLFHMADCNDCSCPDRQQRGTVCKHMRACRLWMAAFKTGAVSPKREIGATPEDDRIAITHEGAALLREHQDDTQLMSDDEAALMFAFVAASEMASRETRYAAIYGMDDDKPFCSDCRRHHERGQHYAVSVAP